MVLMVQGALMAQGAQGALRTQGPCWLSGVSE